MAVLVSCPITRPPSPSPSNKVSRRLPALPVRASVQTPSSEDAAYYSHQRENVATLGGKMSMRTHVPSDIDQTLSSCYCSPSVPANSQIINLEEAGLTIMKILYIHHMIMECMSDHQKMASVTFTKSLVVVNALMLTLPFKALAETCELNIKSFSMSLLFTIALIGATVGGLLARQRRGELKRLNDQLRQINEALRRQAKMESYAPNLSYAPVGVPEAEVIVDPRKGELVTSLRAGKNFLRNQDPEKAFVEFKAALNFAQSMGDHIEEKKAVRGLGASLQRQGKHKEAIKYHSKVLEIAKRSGEDSGCTEAYGAIADCYTELGDLDQAGKFYDKYIARLKSD
uniref:Protein FLUORESCENT IN BLUE LIGHT, chloroplastic n=1 Tax=Anthurium amnicola TaxID=1678845 RepID=A0A1D1YQT3_9ARAE